MSADQRAPGGLSAQHTRPRDGVPAGAASVSAAERRRARAESLDRELRRMALLHRRSMRRQTPLVRAGGGRLTAGA